MAETYASLNVGSASTNGQQVKVAATATPGTTLHTAVSGTTTWDLVTIEACNTSTSAVELTIEWGGTTSPDDLVILTLQPRAGAVVVIDRRRIQNSLVVRAFATVANVVVCYVDVDRYDQS